jgi:hypothetical protein
MRIQVEVDLTRVHAKLLFYKGIPFKGMIKHLFGICGLTLFSASCDSSRIIDGTYAMRKDGDGTSIQK